METITSTIYAFPRTKGIPKIDDYRKVAPKEIEKLPSEAVKNYLADLETGFETKTIGPLYLRSHFVYENDETAQIIEKAIFLEQKANAISQAQYDKAYQTFMDAKNDHTTAQFHNADVKEAYSLVEKAKLELVRLESIQKSAENALLGLRSHFMMLAKKRNALAK